jgi:hypothetical protein
MLKIIFPENFISFSFKYKNEMLEIILFYFHFVIFSYKKKLWRRIKVDADKKSTYFSIVFLVFL